MLKPSYGKMETIYFLQIPGNLYSFKFLEIYSIFPKKRFSGFTPLKRKIRNGSISAIGFTAAQTHKVSRAGDGETVIAMVDGGRSEATLSDGDHTLNWSFLR